MASNCIGINNRNIICKRKVKCGKWCSFHINQTSIEHYSRPVPYSDWPRVEIINSEVSQFPSLGLVMKALRVFFIDMQVHTSSLFNSQAQINYAKHKCLILTAELLKRNVHVCYGVGYLDGVIESCIKNLIYPEHRIYAEDFKRKCLKSYREQAQKRLQFFYFKNVEGLCFDVVEKIMEYV